MNSKKSRTAGDGCHYSSPQLSSLRLIQPSPDPAPHQVQAPLLAAALAAHTTSGIVQVGFASDIIKCSFANKNNIKWQRPRPQQLIRMCWVRTERRSTAGWPPSLSLGSGEFDCSASSLRSDEGRTLSSLNKTFNRHLSFKHDI